MNIHANGEVSACCSDWKSDLVYGDVKINSLKEIWNSNKLKEMQIKTLKGRNTIKFCSGCFRKSIDIIKEECVSEILERIEYKG